MRHRVPRGKLASGTPTQAQPRKQRQRQCVGTSSFQSPEVIVVAAPESSSRVFMYGRLALWLVLFLIVASIVYSGWHVVANWKFITV